MICRFAATSLQGTKKRPEPFLRLFLEAGTAIYRLEGFERRFLEYLTTKAGRLRQKLKYTQSLMVFTPTDRSSPLARSALHAETSVRGSQFRHTNLDKVIL